MSKSIAIAENTQDVSDCNICGNGYCEFMITSLCAWEEIRGKIFTEDDVIDDDFPY